MSDRPMHRQLVRLAAQALDPGRAHRADLWPGLEIDPATGTAAWRHRPLPPFGSVSALVPRGLPLLTVVGSGPSLGAQDPRRIEPGTALLLNGAIAIARQARPLAALVEDERFVHRHWAMVAALPPAVPLMLSPGALRALLARAPDAVAGRRVAILQDLRRPLGGRRRPLADPTLDLLLDRSGHPAHGAALSRDPDRGVVVTGTVAFTALQAALAARPARILLAGIDLANADALPRFYERPGQAAPSGLVRGLPRILKGFALALAVARREGIGMACASPNSALLVLGYPRDPSLDA